MIPVTVTAQLAVGIAAPSPWGVSLDGLLAAQLWAGRKQAAVERGEPVPQCREDPCPPDLDLPLARCHLGDPWHWAATCAYPSGHDPARPPEQRYWTSFTDHRDLDTLTTRLPKVVSQRQGRYRTRRIPTLVVNATQLTWTGIGDPDRIRDLVSGLRWIGKRRHTGEGQVLAWAVTPCPGLDPFWAGHLYPTGVLGRPVPPGCLHRRGMLHGGRATLGLRPPYHHPARCADGLLPGPIDPAGVPA